MPSWGYRAPPGAWGHPRLCAPPPFADLKAWARWGLLALDVMAKPSPSVLGAGPRGLPAALQRLGRGLQLGLCLPGPVVPVLEMEAMAEASRMQSGSRDATGTCPDPGARAWHSPQSRGEPAPHRLRPTGTGGGPL